MQPHDIYFVAGVLLFFLGIIGYLSARSEGDGVLSPILFVLIGIGGVGYAYLLNGQLLKPIDFMDSALRIFAAIF
ncbi:hypothetical protein F9L33_09025 [Amylibacter sp. SFDW26]|uniref:hypothetical protein n=1 Tax=Amylibacter sp. SFDW26 TaxID=2652722 RepID=UPI001261F49A|nr:hypothetical protein [Amylibacter sp. SFDW26]KAB7614754.1 hypothetical protein F9L33_09025 [Amylibacter sp. SFDW26]